MQKINKILVVGATGSIGVASHEICDTLPRNLRHYNCRRFNGSASNLNTF